MFPLGSTGKYVAMASLYNWAEGGYYTNEWFLGTIKDSKTFVLEDRGLLDFGQYYAARTGSEDQSPTGRRVLFSATGWHNPPGEKTFSLFWRHFILKTERWPRQARDKHRENSNNGRFLPGMAHCNTQVHLIPRDMALDAKGRVTFSPIPEIAATLRASRHATKPKIRTGVPSSTYLPCVSHESVKIDPK